jgi:carboxyl-terminal processing protease
MLMNETLSHLQLRIRLAALLTTLFATTTALTGCGAGVGSSTKLDSAVTTKDEISYLSTYMNQWYLWYKELPSVDLNTFTTVEAALKALKVPQDKFSAISSTEESQALFVDGKLLAFGLTYKLDNNQSLKVRFVQPNSPALAAGLLRGDSITAVNGESIATLVADNRFESVFGPQEAGITRTFAVTRGATTLNITIAKAWFDVNSTPVARTITVGTGVSDKVGYVLFNQFTNPALAQWRSALQTVKGAGATKVIVDLRFNGGGLVSVSAASTAGLAPSSAAGKVFAKLAFNDKNSGANSTSVFTSEAAAGTFNEVIFLTSPSTCSAAEEMIVGLQPYLPAAKVTLIGQTTCGKPVGFTAPDYNGKRYNIVSFRSSNAAGKTDYFDGLVPACGAIDDFIQPIGADDESMLAVALAFVKNGTCPAVANTAQTKSFAGQQQRLKETIEYWTLPETGLGRETGIQ